MPTPETSASIAREYGAYLAKDIPEANCLKNEIAASTSDYILEFLSWLSENYCIVPKTDILNQHAWYMQRMKEVSSARQMNRGKAIALETLFGPQLFEEKQ